MCYYISSFRKHNHLLYSIRYIDGKLFFTGGLFANEPGDKEVENAFKFAVYRINKDKTLLNATRLDYVVEHISAADSYLASKAGKSHLVLITGVLI